MGLALFKERRLGVRRSLTGLLPGKIIYKETGVAILAQPVDVSTHGIGILSKLEMKVGSHLGLFLEGREILLEIMWCRRDFSKQDILRYGLCTLDDSHDLEAEFIKAGCIK
jgi:hypothetical protein